MKNYYDSDIDRVKQLIGIDLSRLSYIFRVIITVLAYYVIGDSGISPGI